MLDPMRKGAGSTEQDDAEGRARRTHAAVRLADELGDLGGADAFMEDARSGLVHLQGHVLGALHQRDFGWRLALAAGRGDAPRVDETITAGQLANAFEHEKRQGRTKAYLRRRTIIGQYLEALQAVQKQRVGAFVLLPGIDRAGHHLKVAHRAFLERRRQIFQCAAGRQNRTDHALAGIPLHAGEVLQVAAGGKEQRGDILLAHQRLSAGDACLVLRLTDRLRAGHHVLQARQGLLRRTAADSQCHLHILVWPQDGHRRRATCRKNLSST